MSTANLNKPPVWEKFIRPERHQEFYGHFDEAERRHLIEEDLAAGISVSSVLAAVVLLGVVAMVATVIVTLL
jgi:hypothetical protein